MLYPCVADEAGKHPGLATKIPIEFVIGNDGRVSKVWVDHSLFKDTALADCLLKELQKWPFRAYEGERATVGLSFRVGRGS
jgi:peroxiredoxin